MQNFSWSESLVSVFFVFVSSNVQQTPQKMNQKDSRTAENKFLSKPRQQKQYFLLQTEKGDKPQLPMSISVLLLLIKKQQLHFLFI